MSKTKYTALATVHFTDATTGERKIAQARGALVEGKRHHGVFSGLDDAEAKRLEKLGALRASTKEDLAAVDSDDEGAGVETETPAKPAFTSKHIGGGKWVVQNAEGQVVSGEEKFESKEDAQKWADAKTGEPDVEIG